MILSCGEALIDMLPRKRPGKPEDLDGLLLLLAAEEAHFINGAIITADANLMTKAVAEGIVQREGHYLLALKQNQRTLRAEVERAFIGVPPGHEAWDWATGNVPVCWRVSVQRDLRWVDEAGRWPCLANLVRVETLRCPADTAAFAQPVRYYLSSHAQLSPDQALAAVRGHWAIENQLHWHLDVTLGEDAHRLRDPHAAAGRRVAARDGEQTQSDEAVSRHEETE